MGRSEKMGLSHEQAGLCTPALVQAACLLPVSAEYLQKPLFPACCFLVALPDAVPTRVGFISAAVKGKRRWETP